MENKYSHILGIDFGTSKSVVAVMQDKTPVIIPDRQGRTSIPSLVMVTPDEKIYIGRDALTHPDRYKSQYFTINSIKRQMGKTGETSWGQYKTYPQEVSALILGNLKLQAEAYCNQIFTEAVIAVPAHFDINQRWATIQAAEIAGLKVRRLLNEATAAALASRNGQNLTSETELIFDFGAGTLDVSILECGDHVYEVKSTAGDGLLGGDDIDQRIVRYLLEKTKHKLQELSPMQLFVLKEAATRAKVELSGSLESRIYLPGFFQGLNKFFDLDITIPRAEFEKVWDDLFRRAIKPLEQALADANLKASDIDRVILIGGTSKIPRIRTLVKQVIGKEIDNSIDPELGVALGACVMAGVLSGDIGEVLLLDVTPSSYSVETQGGVANRFIERNTTIPCLKSDQFSTVQDNQTEITIRVFEGEMPMTGDNTLAGTVTLSGLLPAPRGIPKIKVTFDIYGDNTLFVSAMDLATDRKVQAVMESPYRLNPAQIKVLQRKVSKELEPIQQKEREIREQEQVIREQERENAARNDAVSFARQIDIFLAKGHNLDPHHASLLEAGKKLIVDYLDWNTEPYKLSALLASIRETYTDSIVSMILDDVMLVSNSTKLMQWVTEVSENWENPASLASSLQQFENQYRLVIDKVLVLNEECEPGSREALYAKAFDKLKISPPSTLFLAMVLGRYAHVNTFQRINTTETQNHLLYTIILLGYLDEGTQLSIKQRAAKAICDHYNNQECFFLIKYVLAERDKKTAFWLQNCFMNNSIGSWCRYYHGLKPEEKEPFLKNEFLLHAIRKDAAKSLALSSTPLQMAAIQIIKELGLDGELPELLSLLNANREMVFTIQLIELLSAVQDAQVIIPLLCTLGSDEESIRQTSLVALEGFRNLMAPDISRFFDITKQALTFGMPKGIGNRLFLWKFMKYHPELKEMINSLEKSRQKK